MKLLKSNTSGLESYQKDLIARLKDKNIDVKSYNRTRDNQWIIIKLSNSADLNNAYCICSEELDNSIQIDDLTLKILIF